jgi:hypothetical protein
MKGHRTTGVRKHLKHLSILLNVVNIDPLLAETEGSLAWFTHVVLRKGAPNLCYILVCKETSQYILAIAWSMQPCIPSVAHAHHTGLEYCIIGFAEVHKAGIQLPTSPPIPNLINQMPKHEHMVYNAAVPMEPCPPLSSLANPHHVHPIAHTYTTMLNRLPITLPTAMPPN